MNAESWKPRPPVVVRIFRDYASGMAPRQIARKLNEEKVARSGGPGLARYDHSRAARARHRHPEQQPLCW